MKDYESPAAYAPNQVDLKLGELIIAALKRGSAEPDSEAINNLFKTSSFNRDTSAVLLTADAGKIRIRHVYSGKMPEYRLADAVNWICRHPELKQALKNENSDFKIEIDLVSKKTEPMSGHFVSTSKKLGTTDFRPGLDGLIVYYDLKTYYILPSDFDMTVQPQKTRTHSAIEKSTGSSYFSRMRFSRIRTHAYRYESGTWKYLNGKF